MADRPAVDAVAALVGFGRTLRAAGVPATADRVQAMLSALGHLDPTRRDDVYWAGRLTLCGDAEDLPRYDRAFEAYFSGERPRPGTVRSRYEVVQHVFVADTRPAAGGEDGERDKRVTVAAASETEVLRRRDLAKLSAAERAEVRRLVALLDPAGLPRRTRRFRPSHRGALDADRTIRAILRRGGEPARLLYHAHRTRPRRLVLLVDVSGSMARYADALLRFAHAAACRRPGTEVFTIGTRLTRVSRELRIRDPDAALAAAASVVPDWSGGTRLGELLKAFLDRWGQRGMARGAVVLVASDGWERGDAALLGEQMARLARLAARVVWVNPHKGRPGYQPLAAGMQAALPYVDDFVEGHTLAALEELCLVLSGGRRARRAA